MKKLIGRTVLVFEEHCETGLFRMKLHLSDQQCEDPKGLGSRIPGCLCV